MRIVSGIYGGRVLEAPKDRNIRPTSDKVRGAMFNALQSRGAVADAVVLDCFCGSGALGLEALSQGAAHCTFIDKARSSLDLARRNAQALGVEAAEFILKDATKLSAPMPDDVAACLVFLDPPYGQGLAEAALRNLQAGDWLTNGAICVVEENKSAGFNAPSGFEIISEKTYGDTAVIMLAYKTPQ